MRARSVKEISEADIKVSDNQTVEELLDIISSADRMTKDNIEPLLHSADEYKAAKKLATELLKKKHRLSQKEIDSKLNELYKGLNEHFDVLTWSRKKLPEEIANDVEEAHEGGFGEKLQTSLLKVANKEELLQWYNKNFEVGLKESIAFTRSGDSKRSLDIGSNRFRNKIDEYDLEGIVELSGMIDKNAPISEVMEYMEENWDVEELPEDEIETALYLWDLYKKGLIEEGEFYDHHEFEKMMDQLPKNQKKWPFAYNGYPEGDGIAVILSKVEFPSAENLYDEL